MVHLCARPLGGQKWCTLGRETAIQKMIWDKDGWLRLKDGAQYAQNVTEPPCGVKVHLYNNEENGFFDDFENDILNVRYSSPRESYENYADCKSRKGYLRIKGRESMNSLHHVSLVAVRQQRACCSAQTVMEFMPEYPEQLAGLSYMYDAMNFYIFAKTADENGNSILTLIKSDKGVITEEIATIPVDKEAKIELKIALNECGTAADFYYKTEGAEWKPAGVDFTTEIVTDEYCRGFTGAHFGLYCHDMTGLGAYADFDYMKVE